MAVDVKQKEPVAVARLPKSNFLIKIIDRVGVPITSSSLNLAGEETIQIVDQIENYIPTKEIDL